MSIRMRHTKGHTRNRRSHHALNGPRLSRDTETNSFHLRHRVDMKTGVYRGKKIFDPATPVHTTEEKPQASKAAAKKSSTKKKED